MRDTERLRVKLAMPQLAQPRPRYEGRFSYKLCGGPYNGREIIRGDLQHSAHLPFYDPYETNASSYAIYGTRDVYQWNERVLWYWGREPCPPERAHEPEFYQN